MGPRFFVFASNNLGVPVMGMNCNCCDFSIGPVDIYFWVWNLSWVMASCVLLQQFHVGDNGCLSRTPFFQSSRPSSQFLKLKHGGSSIR